MLTGLRVWAENKGLVRPVSLPCENGVGMGCKDENMGLRRYHANFTSFVCMGGNRSWD